MNLHEYQAKTLLRDFGIPLPPGAVAATPDEAQARAGELAGNAWVLKAQVHAGERQAAGGVRMVKTPKEVAKAAADLLGTKIVTGQTGRDGLLVKKVYVEQACDVEREIYAALLVNRAQARIDVVASREGGADVERALARRESLIDLPIGETGLEESDVARLAEGLGLSAEQGTAVAGVLAKARRAFVETDASLIEFNPLAITKTGEIVALDVKMVLDDNALGRHPELAELRDEDEIDPQEREADRYEHNYARLDGNIGLMTTGAGLGLAAIDLINEEGGEPANFMDTRPMASREQIAEGILLLLRDKRVRVVLVMAIGGGILHCDTIAEGIAAAFRQTGAKVPVVYHAAGTGKEISELTLRNQGIPAIFADSMEEAAHEAVRIAGSGAG
ncbi:MAG: ADP-forming succinate--CoA ligase subunit beta [Alphaproteobacteria bacterium]|nr:ADP-forming succinate--CoA ligase subunit beta [Alphaproteobacteria bacterium]